MKNPLVIFVGVAVATLAALVWATNGRWQSAEAPAEVLSQVQQGQTPAADEPKVALTEPPAQSSEQPPGQQAPAPAEEQKSATSDTQAEKPVEKPAEDAAQVEKPAQGGEQQQAAVEPKTEVEEPAKTPEAAAPRQQGEQPAAQRGEKGGTFDVVRIEANGEAVFAGRCDPGAEVALLLNGRAIGTAKANAEGEWLIVPESPIPPGSHELTLESTNPNGRKWGSDQTLAVKVEPEKKPLIVLSTPNAPSKVLQKPEEQVAVAESQAPSANEAQTPKAETETPAAEAPSTGEQTAPAPQVSRPEQPQAEQPQAEQPQPQQAEPEQSQPEQSQAAQPKPAPEQAPSNETQQTAEGSQTSKAPAPAEQAQPPAEVSKGDQMAAAQQPEGEAGQRTPPVAGEQPKPPATELKLDTVDYNDQGDIIFSGRAEAGASVRLYVDNKHVGDAIADAAGAWSFAGREQIGTGAHRLRADLVDPTGKVSQRIELPFMRADPNQVAALHDQDKQSEQQTPTTEQKSSQQPAAEQPTAEQPKIPETAQPKAEQLKAEQPTAEQPKTEEPKVPETAQPKAEQPAAEAPKAEEPKAEERKSAEAEAPQATTGTRSNQQPEGETAEQPPAEQPKTEEPKAAQTEQPKTETSEPSTGEQKTAAAQSEEPAPKTETLPRKGKIVIQPGNNLWRISRVIYGKGVRYTTIFEANKDQIRDPDLIYPGQIFATPNVVPPEAIDPKRREPLTAEETDPADQAAQ